MACRCTSSRRSRSARPARSGRNDRARPACRNPASTRPDRADRVAASMPMTVSGRLGRKAATRIARLHALVEQRLRQSGHRGIQLAPAQAAFRPCPRRGTRSRCCRRSCAAGSRRFSCASGTTARRAWSRRRSACARARRSRRPSPTACARRLECGSTSRTAPGNPAGRDRGGVHGGAEGGQGWRARCASSGCHSGVSVMGGDSGDGSGNREQAAATGRQGAGAAARAGWRQRLPRGKSGDRPAGRRRAVSGAGQRAARSRRASRSAGRAGR